MKHQTIVSDFLESCKEINQPQTRVVEGKPATLLEKVMGTGYWICPSKEDRKSVYTYIVKARICPEHKIRDQPYLKLDTRGNIILEVSCISCVASSGVRKQSCHCILNLTPPTI
ncbi:uncharacterized protein LOC114344505 [Diabrotica virgifera virgifera]|uniref:Uncharacterized protein n=1 Tax=Diabrotica virgifera virgifera TaxID=50390 RepID=A0ABM5IZ50_DIAVI|nr:uncharacterized protein LOC114344505 [Diabrotica virgifera virgifera]